LATSTPFHRAKKPPAFCGKRDWNDKHLTPTRESIFVDNLLIEDRAHFSIGCSTGIAAEFEAEILVEALKQVR
jgi:hypothetical protein